MTHPITHSKAFPQNSPRGTQDLLPKMATLFRGIHNTALQWADRYGFEEISTPIFEAAPVFSRTLGDSSDLVTKEMYTFQDRGGDDLILRPEGTAGIVRSILSNGLLHQLPLKYYYFGPMFRYERPQKGRYRQFHQIGVECLGYSSPLQDVEAIALACDLLKALKLDSLGTLEINTLGDSESRQKHRDLLVEYFKKVENHLSPESQLRLHRNPMRILDSKDPEDRKWIQEAPSIKSCLNETSKKFFEEVKAGLSALSIPFEENPFLVRGLDYYTHTVFEFTTTHLGSQGALIAGGRYDGLMEQMGGPSTPAFGWAGGVERLALLVQEEIFLRTPTLAVIIPTETEDLELSLNLAHRMRTEVKIETPLTVELFHTPAALGKQLKRANKMGARWAILVGSKERESGYLSLKDLQSGEQKSLKLEEVLKIVHP